MPNLITGALDTKLLAALKLPAHVRQLDTLLQDDEFYEVPVITGALEQSLVRSLGSIDAVKELDLAISAGVAAEYTFSGNLERRLARVLGSLGASQELQALVAARLAGEGEDSLLTGQAGYWHLSNTTDSGPNGYTLTNADGVTFGAGQVANCAVFNGANALTRPFASVALLNFAGASFGGGYAWKQVDNSESCTFLNKAEGGTVPEWAIGTLSGQPFFVLYDATGAAAVLLADTALGTAVNNTWYQTYFWFDSTAGANGTAYIKSGILNGSLGATVSAALSAAPATLGDSNFSIGTLDGASGYSLDEVLILNRALTGDEISRWFTNVKAGNVPV